jgi:hypothetical protein
MQGHFVGFHAYYAHINAGFLPVNILRDSRKEGNMYGAGASYGYNWRLSAKWRLECVAGLGYAHLNYLVYQKNGEQTGGTHYYNYAGPTKLAVNLIYIIK